MFLNFLEKRKRSLGYYLFYKPEELPQAGIMDIGETCGFALEIRTEYETVHEKHHELPASKVWSMRFYEQPDPRHPRGFVRDQQEFPLSATKQIIACSDCTGNGRVQCSSCHGSGRQTCHACHGLRYTTCLTCAGTGQIQGQLHVNLNQCSACGGTGGQTCPSCGGTGGTALGNMRINCIACGGTGKTRCLACSGTGTGLQFPLPRLSQNYGTRPPSLQIPLPQPCQNCGGTGKIACRHCGASGSEPCAHCVGTGFVTCGRCTGEGQLLTYTSKVYTYFPETDREGQIIAEEVQRADVIESFHDRLDTPGAYLELRSLNLWEEVVRQLGVMSDQIATVTQHAVEHVNELLETAKKRPGRIVSQQFTGKVVPMSFVNTRLGKKYRPFWLIGTRGHAKPLPPGVSYDLVKLLGLGTLVFSVIAALSGYVPVLLPAIPVVGEILRRKIAQHRALEAPQILVLAGTMSSEKAMLFALLGYVVCDEKRGSIHDEFRQKLLHFLKGEDLHPELSANYSLRFKNRQGKRQLIRIVNLNASYLSQLDQNARETIRRANHLCFLLDAKPQTQPIDQQIAAMLENWDHRREHRQITMIVKHAREKSETRLSGTLPVSYPTVAKFQHRVAQLDIPKLQQHYLGGTLTDNEKERVMDILENI